MPLKSTSIGKKNMKKPDQLYRIVNQLNTQIKSINDRSAIVINNGFENLSSSVVSFSNSTRIVQISGSYTMFSQGGAIKKTSETEQVTIPNVTSQYFVYFNRDAILTADTTGWNILTDVPVATVSWNASLGYGSVYDQRIIPSKDWPLTVEYNSRTISFNNALTAAQMQIEIDKIGRYLDNGVTITIQFADGTYTMDQSLQIEGFCGPGRLNIHGNTADSGATKSVILNFSGKAIPGILVNSCLSGSISGMLVTIRNIKVNVAGGQSAIFVNCATNINVVQNTVESAAQTGTGVLFYCSTGIVNTCYFTRFENGVQAHPCSVVRVVTLAASGVAPIYGLYANGGIIQKGNTTQIIGATLNDIQASGGVISGSTGTPDTLWRDEAAAEYRNPREVTSLVTTVAGTYTLNFTSAFSATPRAVATALSSTAVIVTISAISTSSITIKTFDTAGVAVNASVMIHVMGRKD
jgi:hypothetical protein